MKPRPAGRRHRRTLDVQPAASAIANVLAVNGLSEEIRGNRILDEWSELVGPRVASHTRPEGITSRVLWIEVATSAWLHELNLLKSTLAAQLTQRLGPPPVFDEIKFRLARRTRREGTTAERPRVRTLPPPVRFVMPATGAARERIVREVATVDDVELRDLITRVRITHDK